MHENAKSMKPYHSIILFVAIVCCAAASSIHSYGCAKELIIADMNQALAKTLAAKQDGWITPDTIADYRNNLKLANLKQTSLIYYAINSKSDDLHSKRIMWKNSNGTGLLFQGYANCSMASVFAMSDQRLPASLSAIAILWALLSAIHFRRSHAPLPSGTTLVLGGIMLNEDSKRFTTLKNEDIALTPMQEQLLAMFFHANGHRLSKQDICGSLWPKKPDASDTLYALIRRIKPVLADNGLTITTGRGKDYQLSDKCQTLF